MAALDELIPGEAVVHSTAKHWIAPLRTSLVPLALVVGAFLIRLVTPESDEGLAGVVGNLFDLARTALLVGGIGWIAYNIVVWRTATFAVTNRRVIREEGIISRRSSATILGSITDVQTRVSALGNVLGYGDLVILGQSGEAAADRFVAISDPRLFRDRMLAAKVDADEARSAAPAPAAVGHPPEDPIAMLGRLAELRDGGALTPQEFEAKKSEILARI